MYNEQVISKLSDLLIEINAIQPADNQRFINSIFNNQWPEKSLNERVNHIATNLQNFFPKNYLDAIPFLEKLTIAYLKSGIKKQNYTCQFIPHYISLYGKSHPQESIKLIEKVTELTSCEFVIRHFIISEKALAMEAIGYWAKSESENIRRLASEGCRPRLPWGIRLKSLVEDPSPIFPILELLIDDTSIYVRNSIANNLNDIAKDHPESVIRFCQRMVNGSNNRQWIAKNALRTLLKAGNKEALALFNWHQIEVINPQIKPERSLIAIGESIRFDFAFKLLVPSENLRIELIVYYPRKKNEALRKVFQWGNSIENDGLSYSGFKSLKFENMSTRKITPGIHKIELALNGQAIAATQIEIR